MRTYLRLPAFAALSAIFLLCAGMVTARQQPKQDATPKVTSKELAEAYAKNETAAEKKFGDRYNPKELVIEGSVVALENGKYGLIAKLEGYNMVRISALLRKEDESSVKKGEKVTLRGKCRGLYEKKNVDINGSVIIKD